MKDFQPLYPAVRFGMSGVGSESLHCQEVPPTFPVHSDLRTTALGRHSGPKSCSIKLFLTTNHSMKFYTMTQDTNKSLMKHIFPNPCDATPIFFCYISLHSDPLNQDYRALGFDSGCTSESPGRAGVGGWGGTRLLQNLWGWVQASVADKALQMIPTCSQGLERFLKCGPSHLQTFWRGKFSSLAPDLPSQNCWVWGQFIALKGDTDAHPDLRPTGL